MQDEHHLRNTTKIHFQNTFTFTVISVYEYTVYEGGIFSFQNT